MNASIGNRTFLVLLLLVVAAVVAVADVPPPATPEPPHGLMLRALGHVSGFRYFLVDKSGEVEEIGLPSNQLTKIGGADRDGPRKLVDLWAVPGLSVPHDRDSELFQQFKSDLKRNKIEGQVKLLSHDFSKPVFSLPGYSGASEVYEISVDSGKPIARHLGKHGPGTREMDLIWAVVAAVSAAAALLVIAGIAGLWFVRRRNRKKRNAEI